MIFACPFLYAIQCDLCGRRRLMIRNDEQLNMAEELMRRFEMR